QRRIVQGEHRRDAGHVRSAGIAKARSVLFAIISGAGRKRVGRARLSGNISKGRAAVAADLPLHCRAGRSAGRGGEAYRSGTNRLRTWLERDQRRTVQGERRRGAGHVRSAGIAKARSVLFAIISGAGRKRVGRARLSGNISKGRAAVAADLPLHCRAGRSAGRGGEAYRSGTNRLRTWLERDQRRTVQGERRRGAGHVRSAGIAKARSVLFAIISGAGRKRVGRARLSGNISKGRAAVAADLPLHCRAGRSAGRGGEAYRSGTNRLRTWLERDQRRTVQGERRRGAGHVRSAGIAKARSVLFAIISGAGRKRVGRARLSGNISKGRAAVAADLPLHCRAGRSAGRGGEAYRSGTNRLRTWLERDQRRTVQGERRRGAGHVRSAGIAKARSVLFAIISGAGRKRVGRARLSGNISKGRAAVAADLPLHCRAGRSAGRGGEAYRSGTNRLRTWLERDQRRTVQGERRRGAGHVRSAGIAKA